MSGKSVASQLWEISPCLDGTRELSRHSKAVQLYEHLGPLINIIFHRTRCMQQCVKGALQYKLTRTARRCVTRGGARSCIVRQHYVLYASILYWSYIVRRPCFVRPCIEYPLYCSAPYIVTVRFILVLT